MELIRTYSQVAQDKHERAYACATYGTQRPDGAWEGRVVFFPLDGGPATATDRETTQPRRSHLDYWASGLSQTFLQGALVRALRSGTEVPLTAASVFPSQPPEPEAPRASPEGRPAAPERKRRGAGSRGRSRASEKPRSQKE